MTTELLVAIAKPAAICLLLGLAQFVQDYQTTGRVVPSLIDGLGIAVKAGFVWLGYNGVSAGVQKATAPKVPPSSAPR